MLPTDADSQGRRWIRKLAEHTHLADHLALANTVLHLAVAIDRVRTQLDELGLEDDVPSDEGATPLTGGASHISDARHRPTQPNDAPTDTELSQQRLNVGSSSLPDPDDVLATITEIFERGTRQYRDADATMPGLHELWDRLDGDDKNLLRTYEAATNRNTELWADDRFCIGYALGASGLLRDLS